MLLFILLGFATLLSRRYLYFWHREIGSLDAVSALDIYLRALGFHIFLAGVPVPDLIAHFLLHFYFVAFQEEKIGKAK